MLVSRTRLLSVLTLMAVPAALLVLPGVSRANEVDKSLVSGEYRGLWHGTKVKFIFEKVRPDGTFKGVIRFDKDTPWPDFTVAFDGRVEKDGSITIQRDIKNCNQVSTAGAPKRERGHLAWQGTTSGDGLDANTTYPFELYVPLR
jgi:hypothetical protein